jgi:hypothetical protein
MMEEADAAVAEDEAGFDVDAAVERTADEEVMAAIGVPWTTM